MTNPPRDYAAAAIELGVSETWLRENTPRVPLPHSKFALDDSGNPSTRGRGEVRFFDEDIAEIRAMFHRGARPAQSDAAGRPLSRRRAS